MTAWKTRLAQIVLTLLCGAAFVLLSSLHPACLIRLPRPSPVGVIFLAPPAMSPR
jgi:hypothetical protein